MTRTHNQTNAAVCLPEMRSLRLPLHSEDEDSDLDDGTREVVVKVNGKQWGRDEKDDVKDKDKDGKRKGRKEKEREIVDQPTEWEIDLTQGMNLLEIGAKGGDLWKIYVDRPQ